MTTPTVTSAASMVEDASSISTNPEMVARLPPYAYNLIRATSADNIQSASYSAALDGESAIKLAT